MLRPFQRDPVLWITATLTLAVCIGANTTVFSLVNSILLRPLPYADPARLHWVTERFRYGQMESGVGADYYSLRDARHVFAEVGAYDSFTVNWNGAEKPEQLDAVEATPSFFGTLAVHPLMGRTFDESEQGAKAPPIVVVSYAFWRSRLGSDPHVLGRTLSLDGLGHTIIGVMPQGFNYPAGTSLWRPLGMDASTQLPRSAMRPLRRVDIIARLNPALCRSPRSPMRCTTSAAASTTSIQRNSRAPPVSSPVSASWPRRSRAASPATCVPRSSC